MRRSRPRLFVALDAGSVSGGAGTRSGGGFRLASHARVPLGAGALAPSPFAPNVVRPGEVADALRELARSLRIGPAPVCLLLPDGIARLALLAVPADVTPPQYARFRLVPGPAEPRRLAEEVQRTSVLAGDGAGQHVRVVGAGAGDLLASWRANGGTAEPGWRSEGVGAGVEPSELAWLGATD